MGQSQLDRPTLRWDATLNRSRRGIIFPDGVMISIAPTTCSRSYRTAQVAWRCRFCESHTAPRATPWHENHARSCVSNSLCGSDSSSGFQTVLRFVVTNKTILRFVVKIDFKLLCVSGCVSATKHQTRSSNSRYNDNAHCNKRSRPSFQFGVRIAFQPPNENPVRPILT